MLCPSLAGFVKDLKGEQNRFVYRTGSEYDSREARMLSNGFIQFGWLWVNGNWKNIQKHDEWRWNVTKYIYWNTGLKHDSEDLISCYITAEIISTKLQVTSTPTLSVEFNTPSSSDSAEPEPHVASSEYQIIFSVTARALKIRANTRGSRGDNPAVLIKKELDKSCLQKHSRLPVIPKLATDSSLEFDKQSILHQQPLSCSNMKLIIFYSCQCSQMTGLILNNNVLKVLLGRQVVPWLALMPHRKEVLHRLMVLDGMFRLDVSRRISYITNKTSYQYITVEPTS